MDGWKFMEKWMTAIDIVKQYAIFQYKHARNQGDVIADNYDIFLLQLLLFWKNSKFQRIRAATALLW